MTKGILFLAALSVLVILPNWLQNDFSSFQSESQSEGNSFFDHITSDVSLVPASKTGVTVVFDLGGVLLDIDTKKALDEMGASNILRYVTRHNINPLKVKQELLKKVYKVLDTIQPEGNNVGAQDPYGNQIPGIMYDWQTGLRTNAEIVEIVFDAMESHPEWFTSSIEKKMVTHVINKMFVPELLISTVVLVPEGLEYVKKCKRQGHTVCVLSNWDSESFELLVKKFPELFVLFDGIITSGNFGKMKPEFEVYEPFVNRITKFGEMVVFIDDQKINTDAATEYGLFGICYVPRSVFLGLGTKSNFGAVEKDIASFFKKGYGTKFTIISERGGGL